MGKPVIAHIKCPICGNEKATVHQNAGRNSKALYFRCYAEEGPQCGTIQPSLSGGQNFIKENMRPLNSVEKSIEADAAAEEARVDQLKASEQVKPKQKKKMFAGFLDEDGA